jgi:hypothetical protein
MAPEQARGEEAGRAADVFSLGATLLHAATGVGPYGKGSPDLLMVRAAQGKVHPVPRSLPPALRQRLQAMLDPRPERRPSAAAVAGGPHGTVTRRAVGRRRRRWPLLAGLGVAGVVAAVAAIAVGARETGDRAAAPTTTTEAPCTALPYQPCGSPVAPNTDGARCLEDFEDYDADTANGCEAAPDGLADGTPLTDEIEATIVPRDDVDTFAMEVGDGAQLLCDGRLTVTITAPAGVALRLEVLDGGEVLGQTTSADGVAAAVTIREPECLVDDATTLTARVSAVGSDRTAAAYLLERRGSF